MKIKILFFGVLLCTFFTALSQKNSQLHTIAFYNLENLFDTIDDTTTSDELSPIMRLKFNKSQSYQKKVANMASVIRDIGSPHTTSGPSLIGIAEVENRSVLQDLIKQPEMKSQAYNFIHYDSPDLRGIDVALLYKEGVFRPVDHYIHEVQIWDEQGVRLYTRDILYVSGYLGKVLIHIMVNHWPSRRGGTKKSNYKREKAAYVCKQIIEKLQNADQQANIIVMGDFNDDPHNSSLKEVLLTKGIRDTLDNRYLFNTSESLFLRGLNTLVYRDQLNFFDQIILSGTFMAKYTEDTPVSFIKAGVFRPNYLTSKRGRFRGYPFRSFDSSGFTGGYSDHYPVYIYVRVNNSKISDP